MTNRHMVDAERAQEEASKRSGAELPHAVPATESHPLIDTRFDPLDSPQPKPMLKENEGEGLKKPEPND